MGKKRSNLPSGQTSPVFLLCLGWRSLLVLALWRTVHHLLLRRRSTVGALRRTIADKTNQFCYSFKSVRFFECKTEIVCVITRVVEQAVKGGEAGCKRYLCWGY
jgi:hypothetical protein